jgi:hypothetical protein
MGPSGNLSGGQRLLALDTDKLIVRNHWKELPMPLAVIDQVNVLGCAKQSPLVFTDCLGQVIGDYTPNVGEAGDGDDNKSVVNDLYSPVLPESSKSAGVSLVEEGSADMIPGVDLPAIVDVVSEPIGVDMGGPQADPPQVDALFDDAVFDRALDDGLKTYELNEPIYEPKAASPKAGMAAYNAHNRKQPQRYIPSMQGNKYQVAFWVGNSCRNPSNSCFFVTVGFFHRNHDSCSPVTLTGTSSGNQSVWGLRRKLHKI